MFAVKQYICHFMILLSYWNRNPRRCWVWLSVVPGCPVAGNWKTLGWQTSHWTPSSPPCCHSRSSCGLQAEEKETLRIRSTSWFVEQKGTERRSVCTHWGQWKRCIDLWWAAALMCRCHFRPAAEQNLLFLHIQAWTSVETTRGYDLSAYHSESVICTSTTKKIYKSKIIKV